MASKVTPLYTETLILLKLWALDTQPAYKSSFNPSLKKEAYAVVLSRLVEDGAITAIPKGKTNDQDGVITAQGHFILDSGNEFVGLQPL